MTVTMDSKKEKPKESQPGSSEMDAAELVCMAKEQGLALTAPAGSLKQPTKMVIERVSNVGFPRLRGETPDHLG
jgi:hypothetical protein